MIIKRLLIVVVAVVFAITLPGCSGGVDGQQGRALSDDAPSITSDAGDEDAEESPAVESGENDVNAKVAGTRIFVDEADKLHVEMPEYSLDLPGYWLGRVDVEKRSDGGISVYPTGDDACGIMAARVLPDGWVTDGDQGSGSFRKEAMGNGKTVVLSVTRYPCLVVMARDEKRPGEEILGSLGITDDVAKEAIDLETGGKLSLEEVMADASAQPGDYFDIVQDYMTENVAPTLVTHPDAVSIALEADPADGDAARREAAEKFSLAIYTNTKVVDGKCMRDTSRDSVKSTLVDPSSELWEWSAGGDTQYDNSILLKGGSPLIAQSAEVVDVQGGAYYVAVDYGIVSNPEPLEVIPEKSELVVLFNDDGKIEHAWNTEYTTDVRLHGKREAYAAYGEKVKEIVAKYGAPGISEASGNHGLTYAAGLAYARLVDFGDGEPRLVACYLDADNCKQPDEPGAYPEDYRVEVWEYGPGRLELAHSGTAQLEGQNAYCGAVVYNEHGGKRYLETWDGSYGGPEGDITYRAYGLGDGGGFGLVTELRNDYSYQDKHYALNGRPVSEEEGQAVLDGWFDHEKISSFGLSSMKYNGHAPSSLIRDTNSVIAVLEACTSAE